MTRIFITIICFAVGLNTTGQDRQSYFEPELSYQYGDLIKIHGSYPEKGNTQLIELGLMWQTSKSSFSNEAYKYPQVGISLIYADLGNDQILGQSIGVVPSMWLKRKWNNFTYGFQFGMGLAAFNKPYDPIENPENLVIGSRITNMTILGYRMGMKISDRISGFFGVRFSHYSNGHVKVPNIGANVLSIQGGIKFHVKELPIRKEPLIDYFPNIKWHWGAQFNFGIQSIPGTIEPTDGPVYPVWGATLSASKRLNYRSNLSFGIHYHYYKAYKEYAFDQELFPNEVNYNWMASNLVLFVGHEFVFNHVSLYIQLGVDLHAPFKQELNNVWDLSKNGFFTLYTSNKIGYRYYFGKDIDQLTKKAFVSMGIKANGGGAEFFETGIGYVF